MQTGRSNNDKPITRPRWGCVWNVLTVFILLAIIGVLGVYFLIFSNPYVSLNPFPPPTQQVALVISPIQDTQTPLPPLPSFTSTQLIFPPTWTATPTLAATETATPKPVVIFPTNTPVSLTPGLPTATATDRPDMPFAILGTPAAFSRTFIYPGADCNWMGVGGQVVDMQDAPIVGMTIKLRGTLNNQTIDMTGLTGTVLQYGPAGYEFTLSNTPVASQQSLYVQVLDQAGLALSAKVYFDTYADCFKNLVLITFKQVR
jgi:hypothetical protein